MYWPNTHFFLFFQFIRPNVKILKMIFWIVLFILLYGKFQHRIAMKLNHSHYFEWHTTHNICFVKIMFEIILVAFAFPRMSILAGAWFCRKKMKSFCAEWAHTSESAVEYERDFSSLSVENYVRITEMVWKGHTLIVPIEARTPFENSLLFGTRNNIRYKTMDGNLMYLFSLFSYLCCVSALANRRTLSPGFTFSDYLLKWGKKTRAVLLLNNCIIAADLTNSTRTFNIFCTN